MARRGQPLARLLASLLAVTVIGLPFATRAGGESVDPASLPQVLSAIPREPTLRLNRDIFGRGFNHAALTVIWRDCGTCKPQTVVHDLPEAQVVEDTEARLVDLDGDGTREALVVVADRDHGAQLTVWGPQGLIATSDLSNAPDGVRTFAGVADFDQDGREEVAVIDNPHTAPELVILRLEDGRFVEVAREPGLTNHSLGDAHLRGGVRRCGQGPELVLARADGLEGIALRLDADGRLTSHSLGGLKAVRGLNRYLRCDAVPQPLAAPEPVPAPETPPKP